MRCGFRSLTVALWSVAEGYCGILAGVAGVPPICIKLTKDAQFIRLCSWLKLVYMYTHIPLCGLPTFTRLARKRREDA